jgi:protein-S-isoprenylcysteine O-methyltransferase Ste14
MDARIRETTERETTGVILRHLLSIVLLPFTVTVLVPVWIARRNQVALAIGTTPIELAIQALGLASLAVGLALFAASLRQFVVRGKGTLAPWDPPKHLVVAGPYRYVRNPMISGVLFIVTGEALVLRSWPHTGWALLFFLLNVTYIPLLEEPQLRRRFGAAYDEYCRHVRRFLPRIHPWPVPDSMKDTQ